MNISIILKSACASGGHVSLGVTVDGGAEKVFSLETDTIRENIRPDDRERMLVDIVRLSIAGLTRAQARSKLQTGFTVTL